MGWHSQMCWCFCSIPIRALSGSADISQDLTPFQQACHAALQRLVVHILLSTKVSTDRFHLLQVFVRLEAQQTGVNRSFAHSKMVEHLRGMKETIVYIYNIETRRDKMYVIVVRMAEVRSFLPFAPGSSAHLHHPGMCCMPWIP